MRQRGPSSSRFAIVAVLVAVGVIVGTRVLRRLAAAACARILHREDRPARSTLNLDQMANAATIAAVGIRRGVPERAVDGRARHRAAGVEAAQPRRRRPRLGRAVPAASVAGLGHGRSRSPTRGTRPASSTRRCCGCSGWQPHERHRGGAGGAAQRAPDGYEKWAGEATIAERGAAGRRIARGRLLRRDDADDARSAALGALTNNLQAATGARASAWPRRASPTRSR